jgi:hypothetical protein
MTLVHVIELNAGDGDRAALKAVRAGMGRLLSEDFEEARHKPILAPMAVDLKIRDIGAIVFVKNGATAVLARRDLELLLKNGERRQNRAKLRLSNKVKPSPARVPWRSRAGRRGGS